MNEMKLNIYQGRGSQFIIKNKRKNYCRRLYKQERRKCFEIFNPVLISVNKFFLEKYATRFPKNPFSLKINNKISLLDNKGDTSLDNHLVQRKLKVQQMACKYMKILTSLILISTKLTGSEKQREKCLYSVFLVRIFPHLD